MTIEPSKPETTPACGCSFERWGRDSFKISVCDEHRGTAGLFGERHEEGL